MPLKFKVGDRIKERKSSVRKYFSDTWSVQGTIQGQCIDCQLHLSDFVCHLFSPTGL